MGDVVGLHLGLIAHVLVKGSSLAPPKVLVISISLSLVVAIPRLRHRYPPLRPFHLEITWTGIARLNQCMRYGTDLQLGVVLLSLAFVAVDLPERLEEVECRRYHLHV
jgi:hypothetical protein